MRGPLWGGAADFMIREAERRNLNAPPPFPDSERCKHQSRLREAEKKVLLERYRKNYKFKKELKKTSLILYITEQG